MSSKCDQNGGQPPIPRQPQNLADSESQNEIVTETENKKDICRNFIWGTCNKNTQCKFRHNLDFEEMKKVLKFCHDYQNPPGCTREHCTYLHTTKEEESLFFATGQLPRVLAERHANMSVTSAETIPQIALYIQESLVGHPPPPPPPPAPVSGPPPPAPLPVSGPVVRQTANMLSLQQLLPPPPPPTVPSTVATSQVKIPVFTAPPPQNTTVYSIVPPTPSVLPMFDASRPPPRIPAQPKNGSLKITSSIDSDAQPCKIRKTEEGKDAVAHCDQCVQRDIRVETLRDEMSRLQRDEEYQALAYKQKLIEYQKRKDVLRSLVNQDLFNLIEEYIEQSVSSLEEVHDVLSQFHQSSTVLPGSMSAVPKQFLIQLIDYIFGSGRNFESMPSPALRLDETLLQTLTTSRRTNTAPKSDVLQTFVDLLKQSNASEPGPASGFASDILKNVGNNINVNGCHRYTNGQKADTQLRIAQPPPYQYAGPPPAPPATPAPPAPPAPPALPVRLYYPPPYQPPSGSSMSSGQLSAPRVPPPPPATPAPPAPPSTHAAPLPACPTYHVGRYPPAF